MKSAPTILVCGNVTLDITCAPVDDVPRHDSLLFDHGAISAGGSASNVAVGVAALGEPVALAACTGDDETAALLHHTWQRVGVQTHTIRRLPNTPTSLTICLVDSHAQPRFLHTFGANRAFSSHDITRAMQATPMARFLYIGGYFVLPTLLHADFAATLAAARRAERFILMDVTLSPTMHDPSPLWAALPHVDLFLCNETEAQRLTDAPTPTDAAAFLLAKGAHHVIIKQGANGCLLATQTASCHIPAEMVPNVVDTTGAGDAFGAGLVVALARGASLEEACRAGHRAAARIITAHGAISAWLDTEQSQPKPTRSRQP
nr:carbohydrate kinase family protein [Ardenticatena sp.]